MKLIQVNAWLGRISGPLARLVKQEQPDLVCMQEALRTTHPVLHGFADQINFIDDIKVAGNFLHEFFAPNWGFNFGSVKVDEGLTILSKHPLQNEQAFHAHQHYHLRKDRSDSLNNSRNWQACSVNLPNGKRLSLANYQGYLDGEKGVGTEVTIETMRKVCDKVAALPPPCIFCGDFNVWPGTPALRVLDSLGLRNLTVENHIPTTLSSAHRAPDEDRARATCDYILVSPEIQIEDFRISEEIVSDHKALIVEFEVPS